MTHWRNSNVGTTSAVAPIPPATTCTTDEDFGRHEYRPLCLRPARTREIDDRPSDPVRPVADPRGTAEYPGAPGAVCEPHPQAPRRPPPVEGARARRALWPLVGARDHDGGHPRSGRTRTTPLAVVLGCAHRGRRSQKWG